MCRLFGLYANKPVNVHFSFYESPVESFSKQSLRNPHGWGIAWFDEKEWHLYKEPCPLFESIIAKEFIRDWIRGKIIISHVRLSSCGKIKKENTHPWLYKGWAFAHNGTIDDVRELEKLISDEYKDFKGETDSERLFHLIVQEINNLEDPVEGIKSAVEKLLKNNISFSSLNFLLSDGNKLYALRYATKSLDYYTLYYIERPKEGCDLEKLSQETQQLIKMKLAYGERAIIIASEKMSDEPYWKEIPNKHLVIVDSELDIKIIDLTEAENK